MTGEPTSKEAESGAFVDRVFGSVLGMVDVISIHIADRLGLYTQLSDHGAANSSEVARRCGIDERYARELLEQQAVTGILHVDDVSKPEQGRVYSLPAAHRDALVDPDSPFSIAPLARAVATAGVKVPAILEAFRTGGGVGWAEYGVDGIESQGDFNRPWIRSDLATTYLPSVPDVHERLTSGARVADVACGVGWAAIEIAKAYPVSTIDGFDLDPTSIEIATKFAKEHGVSDRVRFDTRDAASMPKAEYDLAIVVEAIHDLSHPVEVLSAIHDVLKPDGTLIVADERVGDTFEAPGGDVERLMYGFSILMCLPAGMSDKPSAGTGTVMRPATFRGYAKEAGFSNVEILDQIDHAFLRFYRCTP